MKKPDWNEHPILHKLIVIFVAYPLGFIYILSELVFGGVKAGKKAAREVRGDLEGGLTKFPIRKSTERKDNFYHV